MKRYLIAVAMTTIMTVALVNTALAGRNDPCNNEGIDYAKTQLTSPSRAYQGTTCLNYLLDQNAANGEANFMLGEHCLRIGDIGCAVEHLAHTSVSARNKTLAKNMLEGAYKARLATGDIGTASQLYKAIPGFDTTTACNKFYAEANAMGPEKGYGLFRFSREFCGGANDQEIGKKYLEVAKSKSLEQRKPWLDKASAFISWDKIHSVFPAPIEKTIFEKTYDGRGFGDENIIKTIEGGKDAVSGDTVYIEGSHFWIAVNGHWEEAKGWFNIDQLTLADGKHLKIGAEKGVQMSVKVTRTVKYY